MNFIEKNHSPKKNITKTTDDDYYRRLAIINEKIRERTRNHIAGHFLALCLVDDTKSFMIRFKEDHDLDSSIDGENVCAHYLKEPSLKSYTDFIHYTLSGVASNYIFNDEEIEDFDEYIEYMFDIYCNVNDEQDYSDSDDDISRFLYMIQINNQGFDEYLVLNKNLQQTIDLLLPHKILIQKIKKTLFNKNGINNEVLEDLKDYVIATLED